MRSIFELRLWIAVYKVRLLSKLMSKPTDYCVGQTRHIHYMSLAAMYPATLTLPSGSLYLTGTRQTICAVGGADLT